MNLQRGFTILELLIGMTLLGFILALLFGGFRLAATTWDSVDTHLERTTQEEMARALVRRLLGQMQPLRWKKAKNQTVTFIGERQRLVAVAPLTGQAGSSGLRVIELIAGASSGEDKQSARLTLRHAPLRYPADDFSMPLEGARVFVVLDDLTKVQFDYFGAETKGAEPHWQETWSDTASLPRLVRVRMASPDGGWADVVVAPMVNAGSCPWDPLHLNQC